MSDDADWKCGGCGKPVAGPSAMCLCGNIRINFATEAELRAQRRSYVTGEAAMGSDADEAVYRAAVERGDHAAKAYLDAKAARRGVRAEAHLAAYNAEVARRHEHAEASFVQGDLGTVDPRIAAAVATERERCAKIAETCAGLGVYVGYEGNPGAPSVMAHVIARKIRRGE